MWSDWGRRTSSSAPGAGGSRSSSGSSTADRGARGAAGLERRTASGARGIAGGVTSGVSSSNARSLKSGKSAAPVIDRREAAAACAGSRLPVGAGDCTGWIDQGSRSARCGPIETAECEIGERADGFVAGLNREVERVGVHRQGELVAAVSAAVAIVEADVMTLRTSHWRCTGSAVDGLVNRRPSVLRAAASSCRWMIAREILSLQVDRVVRANGVERGQCLA